MEQTDALQTLRGLEQSMREAGAEEYGPGQGWVVFISQVQTWADRIAAVLPVLAQQQEKRSVCACGWSSLETDELRQQLAEAEATRRSLDAKGLHKLDTERKVFFYENDFYVLSNFSAFALEWDGHLFPTSEHAYHWEKFNWICHDQQQGTSPTTVRWAILGAPSAHVAFKLAEQYRSVRRPDWEAVKVGTMRDILRAKVNQHEYVRRKVLATGTRELIEDSWRDDFWGWGPNRDGQNMLGKLWMEIRKELLAESDPERARTP